MNKVILLGHLGADPQVARSEEGWVLFASLATNCRKGKAKKVDWHRIVVTDEQLVSIAGRDLKKGCLVYVEGRLRTRRWTDQEGAERRVSEVWAGALVLVRERRAQSRTTAPQRDSGSRPALWRGSAATPNWEEIARDIPF
jgi:single-strand DNA-binding protein